MDKLQATIDIQAQVGVCGKIRQEGLFKKIKFWDLIKKIEGLNWKFSKNRETHGIIEPNKYKKGDILRKNAKVFKIVPKRKVIQCGLFVKIFFGQMTNFVPIFYTRCQFILLFYKKKLYFTPYQVNK